VTKQQYRKRFNIASQRAVQKFRRVKAIRLSRVKLEQAVEKREKRRYKTGQY
jgi:hypothetical protein